MEITIITQPSCPQCDFTMRRFDRLGVEYDVIDIKDDPEAIDLVRDLGYQQTPVVIVKATTDAGPRLVTWSGLRPDLINKVPNGTILE